MNQYWSLRGESGADGELRFTRFVLLLHRLRRDYHRSNYVNLSSWSAPLSRPTDQYRVVSWALFKNLTFRPDHARWLQKLTAIGTVSSAIESKCTDFKGSSPNGPILIGSRRGWRWWRAEIFAIRLAVVSSQAVEQKVESWSRFDRIFSAIRVVDFVALRFFQGCYFLKESRLNTPEKLDFDTVMNQP